MWGTKKPCPERIELETRIKQSIDSLAALAVGGEDTARSEREQGSVVAYDRLRRDRDVRAAVLATLRECLLNSIAPGTSAEGNPFCRPARSLLLRLGRKSTF